MRYELEDDVSAHVQLALVHFYVRGGSQTVPSHALRLSASEGTGRNRTRHVVPSWSNRPIDYGHRAGISSTELAVRPDIRLGDDERLPGLDDLTPTRQPIAGCRTEKVDVELCREDRLAIT